MRHVQRQARLAFVLCLAALPAGLVAHLALTDIAHGADDLRLEWGALRVAALVIAAAVVASLRALHGVLSVFGATANGRGRAPP
jgi:hypothetical protein